MAVQDARVAAAAAHWAHRFTANGTDYADFQATLARITRWDDTAAELVLYPDGGHGVTNLAYESRSCMADWFASPLERR